MASIDHPVPMIDTHLHIWKPSLRRYEWLDDEGAPLNADFGLEDARPQLFDAGISGVVLVQAADTYDDTVGMIAAAASDPIVRGVVAWLPLDRPAETAVALELFAASPVVRGVRTLSHTYDDARWLLRERVETSIGLVAARGLTLDVVSERPEQLAAIAEVALRHPDLTVVLDHLGTPPIEGAGWEPWASLLAEVAACPNVSVKISGLSTLSAPTWRWQDWLPYVAHAIDRFGAERVMMGSDWPVSTLAGEFAQVWRAQRQVIAHLDESQHSDIMFGTAVRSYGLDGRVR